MQSYLPASTSFSYLRVGIYLTCNSLFLIKCCLFVVVVCGKQFFIHDLGPLVLETEVR